MSKTIDVGIATAYGAAVRGGYDGTYDKFCEDLAKLADVLSEFLGFSVTVETLDAGTPATGRYEAGILSIGIPQGETGNGIQSIVLNADYTLTVTYTNGQTWTSGSIRGETGATPQLTIGTVSTLDPGQSATAEITGTPEAPVLNFGIPKGQAGASDAGAVTYNPETAYNDGTVDKAVSDLSRQISDLEDTVSTTQIINSASGAIASFNDGADNMPIRKLVAQIEPVQDLHGYDNPWSAGGGKNKVGPLELGSVSESKDAGTSYEGMQIASANRARVIAMIPINAQFTVSWDTTNYQIAAAYFDENGGYLGRSTGWRGWSTVAFTITPSTEKYIAIIVKRIDEANLSDADLTNCKIQLEFNSTATDWTPYSNICPISGHTGAEIEQRGKNLLEPKFYGGLGYNVAVGSKLLTTLTDITNTVTHTGNAYTKSGGSWGIEMNMMLPLDESFVGKRLKFSGSVEQITGFRSAYYVTDKDYIVKRKAASMNEQPQWTIDVEQGDAYLFWYMNSSSAGTLVVTEPQIELGSAAATDYEPYQGNQISVDWEDEAGTVYGGTLDVIKGILTVNKVSETFDGSADETWSFTNASRRYASISLQYNSVYTSGLAKPPFISNIAVPIPQDVTYADITYSAISSSRSQPKSLRYVFAGITDTLTLEEFKTWLSSNPLQVVYLLATPITYQLTPQEIRTLLGANNVWADTGDIAGCEYPADTKLYIDGKIADAIAALQS